MAQKDREDVVPLRCGHARNSSMGSRPGLISYRSITTFEPRSLSKEKLEESHSKTIYGGSNKKMRQSTRL